MSREVVRLNIPRGGFQLLLISSKDFGFKKVFNFSFTKKKKKSQRKEEKPNTATLCILTYLINPQLQPSPSRHQRLKTNLTDDCK